MYRLGVAWRWVWPRRDPALWQLTDTPQVRTRFVAATLLAPLVAFLQLLLYAMFVGSPDNWYGAIVITLNIGIVTSVVLVAAGLLLAREFLARRRGPVFAAIAGTLVYALILALLAPFSMFFLLLYWPVSPGLGALFALELFLLMRLLLHPFRDRFWPKGAARA